MPTTTSILLMLQVLKSTNMGIGGIGGKVLNAIGKTQGGWTTKIHALVDKKGRPLKIIIAQGQVNDNLFARALLVGRVAKNVLADKAYDTNDIRKFINNHGEKVVIPSQGRRTTEISYNKHLYKKRNFVERFF